MRRTTDKRPHIAVFAYSEVGCVCLEELLRQDADVAVVFTHEDDPGENIWFRSVKELAEGRGIMVRLDAKIGGEAAGLLHTLGVELIFSFYYRAIIPKTVLDAARLGAYNVHGALLPRYRGRACVNWAVLNGEKETGSTLHVMTERADRGDIVDQERVHILFEDTAHTAFLKVAGASRKIIARQLTALEEGRAPRRAQDEAMATSFGRRTPEDGKICWDKPAVELYNMVRALTHPFPGAFAEVDGRKMYIWRARPLQGSARPGERVSSSPYVMGTADGLLEILSFQFEGEPERGY